MDTIESRVERLERTARRWRLGAYACAAAAVLAVVWGAAPTGKAPVVDEVVTKVLKVIDPKGRPVLLVATGENGISTMTYFVDGQDAITFAGSDGTVGLTVREINGDHEAMLVAAKSGASISVRRAGKDAGVTMSMDGGSPSFEITDKAGKAVFSKP